MNGMRLLNTLHKPLWILMLFVFMVPNGWAQEELTFKQLPNKIKLHLQEDVELFFKEDLDQTRFTALAGGMSGTPIYKVVIKDRVNDSERVYVARVYSSNEVDAFKNNMISRLIGENNLGPNVVFPGNNVQSNMLITEFAKGEEPNPEDFAKFQDKLADSLRKIHALNAQGIPKGVDLIWRADKHMSKVGKVGPFLGDIRLLYKMNTVLTENPYKLGLVHQDANMGNLFFDGEAFSYIDWANGGFGDVMGDVANVTVEFGLNDEEANKFLQTYLGKQPTKKQTAQFNLWRQAGIFRLTAWAYDNMNQLGGEYKPMLVNMTFPETIKSILKGDMKLKTADDFLVLLGVTHQSWQEHKEAIDGWIKDLQS